MVVFECNKGLSGLLYRIDFDKESSQLSVALHFLKVTKPSLAELEFHRVDIKFLRASAANDFAVERLATAFMCQ